MTKNSGTNKTHISEKNEAQDWNPEKVIEKLLNKPITQEENWIEKRLPSLVQEISENYGQPLIT